MNAISKLTLAAAIFGLTLPALAATQAALPKAQTQGAITYVSGGIGRDEAMAMKRATSRYSLSMVFSAGKHNEYVADVDVTIKNAAGKTLLSAVASGPIMLVKLPPAQYTVTAKFDGKTLSREAHIGTKGDRPLSFHWNKA